MSEVSFRTLHPDALFKPVLPVLKAVSSQLTAMQYAQVFITAQSVHVLATDRYTLVESRETVEGNQPGTMYLPLDVVSALSKLRNAAIVTYSTQGAGDPGDKAAVTVGAQSWTFDVPSYPAVARVTEQAWAPRGVEPHTPLGLSSDTFDTLVKVAKATGKRSTVRFHGTDKGSGPYAVEVTDNVRMLVMPVHDRDVNRTIFADWAPLSETIADAQPAVSDAA